MVALLVDSIKKWMNKFQLVSIEKFRKFHQFYKCLARWKRGGRDLQSPQVNPPPCPPTSPSPSFPPPPPPLLLLLFSFSSSPSPSPSSSFSLHSYSCSRGSMACRYTENKRTSTWNSEKSSQWWNWLKKTLWKWPVVFSCPFAPNQHQQQRPSFQRFSFTQLNQRVHSIFKYRLFIVMVDEWIHLLQFPTILSLYFWNFPCGLIQD